METARDLISLAAIAYKQGQHENAGSLFATAMESSDIDEFLKSITQPRVTTASDNAASVISGINAVYQTVTRPEEVATEQAVTAGQDADDVDTDQDELDAEDGGIDLDTSENDEEDDDTNNNLSEDVSADFPGEKVLPESTSSSFRITLKVKPGIKTARSPLSFKAA